MFSLYNEPLHRSSLLLKQKLLSPSVTIQSTLRDSEQPELQFRVCCLWKQFQGCPCLRQSSFVIQLQRSATLCVPVPARCPGCWQGDPDWVHSAAYRVRPGAQCHSAVQWDRGRVIIKWWNVSWVTAFQVMSALILSLCGDSLLMFCFIVFVVCGRLLVPDVQRHLVPVHQLTVGKINAYIFTTCEHTIYCLCLCNIEAPWWWLQYIAEPCRSIEIALCSNWK